MTLVFRPLCSKNDTHTSRSGLTNLSVRYGLIMRLLGGTSLGSLWVTVQYLCRGKGRRAPASSLLTQAFSMTVLVYVLVHAVGYVILAA